MSKNRVRRIVAIIGFIGSIASIIAIFSPHSNSQDNIIIGGDNEGKIIRKSITIGNVENLKIEGDREGGSNESEDSSKRLSKVGRFYLESDDYSRSVLPIIEDQLMGYGIKKAISKGSGHDIIVFRLRSKVEDRKFINGEYMTRLGTKMEVIDSNNNETLIEKGVMSVGSSYDNYDSAIINASSLLKHKIKNEGLVYELIDKVRKSHSLK